MKMIYYGYVSQKRMFVVCSSTWTIALFVWTVNLYYLDFRIVFCNQRRYRAYKLLYWFALFRVTNRLALKLCLANIKAIPSNGDRSQTQRHDAKQKFENEDCDVLVATNIVWLKYLLHADGTSRNSIMLLGRFWCQADFAFIV